MQVKDFNLHWVRERWEVILHVADWEADEEVRAYCGLPEAMAGGVVRGARLGDPGNFWEESQSICVKCALVAKGRAENARE